MSQNYPPSGGTGATGGGGGGDQGRGQIPGSSRGRGRSRNRRGGVEQGQRNAVEPEDFFALPEQEPVYRYGDRYEQGVRRQGNQRDSLYNYQQPLRQPREYNNDFGFYDDWSMPDRREPYPGQISEYRYRDSQRPPEQFPRYGDRGNRPPPPTPGQLYGQTQHGGNSYHDPQAPSWANTYRTPNTQIPRPSQTKRDSIDTLDRSSVDGQLTDSNSRKRKFTAQRVDKTDASGGLNEETERLELRFKNSSKGGGQQHNIFSGKDNINTGQFENMAAAVDALQQTVKPNERVRIIWSTSLKEEPRAKKQKIKHLQSIMACLPGSEQRAPAATKKQLAKIEAARAAREQERIGGRGHLASDTLMPDVPAPTTGSSIAQGGPEPMDVQANTCGNCKDKSHVVADCNKPQSDGLIHGCAICNAEDHSTWGCEQFPRGNGKKLEQLRELVFKRTNRPPLYGKYWYPLMHPYMQAHPDTEVPGLPWTKEFSQQYHKSKRLQNQLRFQIDNDELETVDPKTSTWQAAVEHYGDPHQRRTKSKAKH